MALDPEVPFGGAEQPTTPPLTESQIRAMRGDLGATPSTNEPTLSIPKAPVFDAEEPVFTPGTVNQMPEQSVDQIIAAQNGKKKLLYVFAGIVGVFLLGAAGYFVIYPMFSPGEPATPTQQNAATAPVVEQPAAVASSTTPQAPKSSHVSSFVNDPDSRTTAVLTGALSKNAINDALIAAATAVAEGTHELIFINENAGGIPFGPFLTALAPSFPDVAKTNLLFTDDFTAFMHKNAGGEWPGYVLTLKPGFAAEDLRAWFSSLEKAPLVSFFLINPGKFSAFKDGTVNNKYPDRYAPATTPGASMSYLMLPQQNKVILSTSFDGLKEALRLMGL